MAPADYPAIGGRCVTLSLHFYDSGREFALPRLNA